MPISISTIVIGTNLVVAVADGVPAFDIARSCKLDTAATAPTVDQSLKNCADDENRARRERAERPRSVPKLRAMRLEQSATSADYEA